MLLTSNEPLRKSKEDINKILRDKKKKWRHKDPKSMGYSKNNPKRKVNSDTSLEQETNKQNLK